MFPACLQWVALGRLSFLCLTMFNRTSRATRPVPLGAVPLAARAFAYRRREPVGQQNTLEPLYEQTVIGSCKSECPPATGIMMTIDELSCFVTIEAYIRSILYSYEHKLSRRCSSTHRRARSPRGSKGKRVKFPQCFYRRILALRQGL